MSQVINDILPEHLRARQTAKRRQSGVVLLGSFTALICLVGAGLLIAPMNIIRKELWRGIEAEAKRLRRAG